MSDEICRGNQRAPRTRRKAIDKYAGGCCHSFFAAVSSIQGSLHYTPCEPIAQLPKSFLLLERRRKWRMEIGEKHNLLGAERPWNDDATCGKVI